MISMNPLCVGVASSLLSTYIRSDDQHEPSVCGCGIVFAANLYMQ